jgi:hypothetical protein
LAPFGREIFPGTIYVKCKHRHRRLIWRALPALAPFR